MKKILIVEAKLHLREWPFMLFTIGLPVGLLVVLGLSIPMMTKVGNAGDRPVDTQMPSMMTLLALLVLACNVVPAVLTTYREQGVLKRMSTTPVHPGRLLGVQLLINLAVGAVSTTILIVVGALVFGSPAPRQWVGFVLVFLLGSAALMAIGLVIAALAPNGKAAPGIGSVAMFPLMFLGGMWVPRDVMPDGLRAVSDFSVAGPFAQALKDTWAGQAPQLPHLAVVAAGLLIFGGLAVRLFRWE
ncbi:ABC transporter permease [Nonomuraea basaltis]|uniref:ABC transporter permease n=1 Tax=Nonomuraea basaltis TaxID=2495887 RepID=UPI00110C62A8|nr:ABC transporter permease [Nonomuraea basaltis]TMS00419.1 ABC transporter permease [Nonomuraea basaltis]